MFRRLTTLRIALGLVWLTVSLVLAAKALGLLPDPNEAILDGRRRLCESLAVSCSFFAQHRMFKEVEATLTATALRHPNVLSAAVRRTDGDVIVEVGDHVIP